MGGAEATENSTQSLHLEILTEERSAEEALSILVPRILEGVSFRIHPFSGKADLLTKLPQRLRAYRNWTRGNCRIVVLVDADDEDCKKLKKRMEDIARSVGFETKTSADGARFQVLNRIAVEELEAWFLGDAPALETAYPRVGRNIGLKKGFRDPDAVKGGTWETLERILQRAGYHKGGLAKIQAARDIARHMDPDKNTSRSFCIFRDGLRALLSS